MKWSKALVLIIFGTIIAAVFVILIWQNNNKKDNIQSSVNTNNVLNGNMPGVVLSQYDGSDKSLVHIKYYSIADGKETTLYSFKMSAEQSSPLFSRYGNNEIFISRAGDEDKDVVITLDGKLQNNFFNPGYSPFMLSPNENKIVYSRYSNENDVLKYRFIVRNMVSGEEKTLESGQSKDGLPQYFKPLRWTTDEKTIYVIPQTDSEGFPDGLYKVNTLDMTYERDQVADQEGLILLAIDEKLHAYGYKKNDFDIFGEKKPTEIYEVNTLNGTYIKHPLQQSRIRQLYSVSDDGNFIAYTYSDSDQLNDLYIYDLNRDTELRVTENAVVSDTPFWQNNKLAFIENKNNTRQLRLYDVATSQVTTIADGIDALIGCYGNNESVNNGNQNIQENVTVNKNEIGFNLSMPENWDELRPGFETTNTAQEREALVILRSPQYDTDMNIIPWDTEQNGAYVYLPLRYFNNNVSFSEWYNQHRGELINQYGEAKEEMDILIDTIPAKKISFEQKRIVDAVKNTTVDTIEEFIFVPLTEKVLQINVEVDKWLYERLQKTVSGIYNTIKITSE